jgi:hypothetical protein
MVAERFVAETDPRNNPLGMEIPIWMSALDMQDDYFGPLAPYVMMQLEPDLAPARTAYREGGLTWPGENYGRSTLRNDWCTTVPIESSNMITIGSLWANQLSEYANDFTDAYLDPGIPSGTLTPGEMGSTIIPLSCWSIWDVDTMNMYKAEYDPDTGEQVTGYGVVATTKDLDGTKILSIWGLTGQDTYYTCWALWMGWLGEKLLNEPRCVTAVVVEFDYTRHPTEECFVTVVETLGTISEYDPGIIFNWAWYGDEFFLPGTESADVEFIDGGCPFEAAGPSPIWLMDMGMWMYRLRVPMLYDMNNLKAADAEIDRCCGRMNWAYGVDPSCVQVTLVIKDVMLADGMYEEIPLVNGVDYFATEQGFLFVDDDLIDGGVGIDGECMLYIDFCLKQPIIHDP